MERSKVKHLVTTSSRDNNISTTTVTIRCIPAAAQNAAATSSQHGKAFPPGVSQRAMCVRYVAGRGQRPVARRARHAEEIP